MTSKTIETELDLEVFRTLYRAAEDLLTGISVHNDLDANAPARRDDIRGPVVSALNKAVWKAREHLAALSRAPEVEAVGWTVGWAALAENGNIRLWKADKSAVQLFAFEHGCEVVRLVSPSPEMGEISREELVEIIDRACLHFDDPTFPRFGSPQAADLILSKLNKGEGLSREGNRGLARSQPGAACPSDCAETGQPLSDGVADVYPGWRGVTQPCDVCGKPVAVNAVSLSECHCSSECAQQAYGLSDGGRG